MLQSFFTSLSGMLSFSKGLDVISNNVSNMNTPGFRASDVFYRNIADESGDTTGFGADVSDSQLRMTAGELNNSGNSNHAAIDGEGFFVLSDEQGQLYYSRVGTFTFNEDNLLVEQTSGFKVMQLDSSGHLSAINISDQRFKPAEVTTQAQVTGNFDLGAVDNEPPAANISFDVYSELGQKYQVTLSFTHALTNVANQHQYTVKYSLQAVNSEGLNLSQFEAIADQDAGTITFDPSGSTSDKISLQIPKDPNFPDGEKSTVEVDFSQSQLVSTASGSLTGKTLDGQGLLPLTALSFTENGEISFSYGKDNTEIGPRLALAHFSDSRQLRQTNDGMLLADNVEGRTIGYANDAVFGRIVGGSFELSNVDLAKEFADMIVIQRGYQASSQVMNISNELIEKLYNSTGGGR